jgi:hypothetical protein
VAKVERLDRLLVPIISLVRSELGLAFDRELYTQIIEAGHQELASYLDEFFRDLAPDLEEGAQPPGPGDAP